MGQVLVPDVVEIVFMDSMTLGQGGWADPSEEDVQGSLKVSEMQHWAVGYVVGENDHGIIVAGTWSQHNLAGSMTVIPKKAILTRRVLTP